MKAIETRYLGPTDRRGSRVRASDSDGNSVIVAVDNSKSVEEAHWRAAERLCEKMQWYGKLAEGSTARGHVFVFLRDGRFSNVRTVNTAEAAS